MAPNDGGTYTCRVSNRVGQGEANATVEVMGERLGVSVAMVTCLFVSVLSMSTCAPVDVLVFICESDMSVLLRMLFSPKTSMHAPTMVLLAVHLIVLFNH